MTHSRAIVQIGRLLNRAGRARQLPIQSQDISLSRPPMILRLAYLILTHEAVDRHKTGQAEGRNFGESWGSNLPSASDFSGRPATGDQLAED